MNGGHGAGLLFGENDDGAYYTAMSLALNAIFGLAALLAGRQLFWAFIAAAGFVLGFNVAGRWLPVQPQWVLMLIGIVLGILGAILAVFAQRVAVAVAGFVAGGFLLLYFADVLRIASSEGPEIVLFIVGGLIGALLLSVLLDPALIILSAAFGAAVLSRAAADFLEMGPGPSVLFYLILFAVGIGVQWAAYSRKSESEARYR